MNSPLLENVSFIFVKQTISSHDARLKYIQQVIDDADLAELFPEQTSSAPTQQPNFTTFSVHNASPENDDKSIADNGKRAVLNRNKHN